MESPNYPERVRMIAVKPKGKSGKVPAAVTFFAYNAQDAKAWRGMGWNVRRYKEERDMPVLVAWWSSPECAKA